MALIGVALSLLGALGMSVQAICLRKGTNHGTATEALLVALVVNIAIFGALVVATVPSLHLTPTALGSFVAAGISGTLLGRVFYFEGIQRVGVSRSEPIKSSQPLHAVLLAAFILGETITTGAMAGAVLIVVGVAYISIATRGDDPPGIETTWVSFLFPVAAAFFLGLEPTLAKTGLNEGAPPVLGLLVKTSVAGVFFGAYVLWKEGIGSLEFSPSNTKWYVAAGIANSTFLLSYYAALNVERVSVVVPIIQTSPVIVAFLSILFLPHLERVSPRLIAGTLVVIAGAITVTLFG